MTGTNEFDLDVPYRSQDFPLHSAVRKGIQDPEERHMLAFRGQCENAHKCFILITLPIT